jgi:small-conductance mechanosensitive channel
LTPRGKFSTWHGGTYVALSWPMKLFVLVLLLIFILPHPVFAADETPARSEQKIEINKSNGDFAIKERIEKVLAASGVVKKLEVSSKEGIVTVSGNVSQQSQIEWVENLIKETDGVIAVINQVKLSNSEILDLQPAKNEATGIIRQVISFLPHILTLILVFGFFLFFAFILSKIGRKTTSKKIDNPILSDLVAKLFALPALLMGVYVVLKLSGLSNMAASFLGGTGALGLILGFAMKNIIENYFSGLILSMRKPYKIGDIVEIGGHQGVVLKLATRGTVLVDFEGNHIIIPNTTIYNNTIINMTSNPSIRIKFTVELPHWVNVADARKIMMAALEEIPQILKDPEAKIMVDGLTLHSVKFMVYIWIDSVNTSFMKSKSLAMEKIKARLEERGVPLANSTMHVISEESHPVHRKRREFIENADTKSERTDVLKVAEKGRSLENGTDSN